MESETALSRQFLEASNFKWRYQIAWIGRPDRAAFLRSQVLMIAPSPFRLGTSGGAPEVIGMVDYLKSKA